jgi:hypothetical protein
MGFVNSLKPIQQARSGDINSALSSLARSSFNRTGRLVFPATIVTVLAWFICQLGFFELALYSDAYWLRSTSHPKCTSWGYAIIDLFGEIINTWFYAENKYDQPQWALAFLLKGSMYIFVTLLSTINTSIPFRIAVETGLYIWSWSIGDCLVGMNVFVGMLIAELSILSLPPPNHRLLKPIPFVISALALYLMSYPDEYANWTPWSRSLQNFGTHIFPTNADFGRFWPGIGAQMLCLSIFFSPYLRSLLSHRRLLYLGSISFPLYLLHGPLMRSVLAWLTFGPVWLHGKPSLAPDGKEDGSQWVPMPRPLAFLIILPLFWIFMFWVVHLWSRKVDPWLGKATKWFEEFAYGRTDSQSALPVQMTNTQRLA